MSQQQNNWQDAHRAQRTPEEIADDARTKRWIWIGGIVLAVWIAVVLLGFTVLSGN